MTIALISTCTKSVIFLIRNVQRQMDNQVCGGLLQPPCCYYTFGRHPKLHYTTIIASKENYRSPVNGFQAFQTKCSGSGTAKHKTSCHSLTLKSLVSYRCYRKTQFDVSTGYQNMNLRLLVPKSSKIICNVGPFSWRQRSVSAGLLIGLLVCFSTSKTSYAEASHDGDEQKECGLDALSAKTSHGKAVLTDYTVIGIPGDGRCLFRSVAHGACIRSGKPVPSENLQRELADELRTRVADEFIKRREETEWFIEGDFETYVSQMRKPHVWGGEPELLMASHVLQMPITVYMHDQDSGGLISIAEYGQEYGKDNPIKVLYHGFGHYDALHVPGKGGTRPRL